MKGINPVVIVVLVLVSVVVAVMVMRNREGFTDENSAMNDAIKSFLKDGVDSDNGVVSKKDIEKAARAAALQYCPVSPDYNPSLYIKKTEIEKEKECPKLPDMKDYVLKSSIPPPTECPPCICPKVNVSPGLCKDGDKASSELACPAPAPCGVKECKNVVKCPAPDSMGIDEASMKIYINKLIREKDYKAINKLKVLLKGVNTPSDMVEDLQDENDKLKAKMRKLQWDLARAKMGEAPSTLTLGPSNSNNARNNTNSPVVNYNQKCENNRVNDWYDISGIIGSAFNSVRDVSNNNNLRAEDAMNASNNMAAKNSVLNNL